MFWRNIKKTKIFYFLHHVCHSFISSFISLRIIFYALSMYCHRHCSMIVPVIRKHIPLRYEDTGAFCTITLRPLSCNRYFSALCLILFLWVRINITQCLIASQRQYFFKEFAFLYIEVKTRKVFVDISSLFQSVIYFKWKYIIQRYDRFFVWKALKHIWKNIYPPSITDI